MPDTTPTIAAGVEAALAPPVAPASQLPAARRKKRDIGAGFGALWLLLIVASALLASLLPLADPEATGTHYSAAPFSVDGHLLGTDRLGRDLLSRAIFGARVSLSVAIGATFIALALGTLIGLISGYYRGLVDATTTVVTNVVLAFPPLILLIALVAVAQPGMLILTIGLAVVGVPTFARIARANTIAYRKREFVMAARVLGGTDLRILARDLLPNVLLPVVSFALLVAAALVVAEGSLSFLGLGIPPPAPSWGGMIAAGQAEIYDHTHLVIVPGAFFFLTVFSLNRVGDWARGRLGRESSL